LKAGSKRHQHIVGLRAQGRKTRFALVALDFRLWVTQSGKEKSD